MKSNQVKWLLIGLAGAALCMALVGGGVFFIAMSAIRMSDEDVDWTDSGGSDVVDAPAEWRRWAEGQRAATDDDPEYQRLRGLYEFVSPYDEIRRRLFLDSDFAFAETELKKQFAAISDPLAAIQYSTTISRLSEFTHDTTPDDLREVMRRWTDEYPDSHFAWLIRGTQAKNYAWYWRGGGRASTVSDEGWERFNAGIEEAVQHLDRAFELEPNDPEIASCMMTICRAQGRPRAELEEYFERATRIVPAHLGAYAAKFQYLRPAWSGSWPEYEEFLASIDVLSDTPEHLVLRIAKRNAQDDKESEQAGDNDIPVAEELQETSRKEWLDIRREMADRWPDDVLVRARYARELMRHDRYPDAMKEFEWIGNRFPVDLGWTLSYYHERRLHSYHRTSYMRPPGQRMEIVEQALMIDPNHWPNHQVLGVVHYFAKEFDPAEEAILRAIELAPPDQGGPHMSLANIYKETGRYEEALDEIRIAKQLKLDDNMRPGADKIENELMQLVNANNSGQAPQ